MTIFANKIASRRTINRIKENGPEFEFVEFTENSLLFNNNPAILVRSKTTDWLGWLPAWEILY